MPPVVNESDLAGSHLLDKGSNVGWLKLASL
jgi:hypothetical protein